MALATCMAFLPHCKETLDYPRQCVTFLQGKTELGREEHLLFKPEAAEPQAEKVSIHKETDLQRKVFLPDKQIQAQISQSTYPEDS